jgi:hypothetical protein
LEAAGPKMKREINRAIDLFNPGQDEDDMQWQDVEKVVKQVASCKKREEEDEGQSQKLQSLVAEVHKLQKLMAKQGVPHSSPILSSSPLIVNQERSKSKFLLKLQVQ